MDFTIFKVHSLFFQRSSHNLCSLIFNKTYLIFFDTSTTNIGRLHHKSLISCRLLRLSFIFLLSSHLPLFFFNLTQKFLNLNCKHRLKRPLLNDMQINLIQTILKRNGRKLIAKHIVLFAGRSRLSWSLIHRVDELTSLLAQDPVAGYIAT